MQYLLWNVILSLKYKTFFGENDTFILVIVFLLFENFFRFL